ncbi:MAG TPA: PadR family transcriptional regulator [Thermoanaerobaculia bacterium]|nr:PadR family transcriptional regulator [Thermoanaerobaculia bacterium]
MSKSRETPQVRSDVLQGTLDLLILKTLSLGPQHGWGISQRLQQVSEDALAVGQGSLYPALHRLQRKGAIESEWGSSENNRRARFYRLTIEGERLLGRELETWRFFTGAVERVLACDELEAPPALAGPGSDR